MYYYKHYLIFINEIEILNKNYEISIEIKYNKENNNVKEEEKKEQLNLYLDVYLKDNRSKTYDELQEPFYKIIGTDPIMGKILCEGEEQVLKDNIVKINELHSTVDDLTKKINDFEKKEKEKKEKGIVIDPSLLVKRNNLREQINTKMNNKL